MAVFNKFDCFTEHVAEGVHNLGANNPLTLALTNTAPTATITQLTGITEITYTNLSSRSCGAPVSSAQTSGTYKLVLNDVVLTASGAVGPFRYVVLYNPASTGVTNAVIGWYDYGSSISLASGETFTVDFDQTNGVLTIA